MIDPRLLGTWRSDRRQTFKHFAPKPGARAEALRRFKQWFGKLIVRYGRRKMYTEFEGRREAFDYELLAADSDTVVIRSFDPLYQEQRLWQIHFEGNRYWIWIELVGMREFFARAKPWPKRRLKRYESRLYLKH